MTKYLPQAPENVRGVVAGIEYPMRLRYLGPGLDGVHVWMACWPDGMDPPSHEEFRGLKVDRLPGRTTVTVEITHMTDDFPNWEQPLA